MSSDYKGPFYSCPRSKTVTFERGSTNIPDCLFRRCDGLEYNVTEIAPDAFKKCKKWIKKAGAPKKAKYKK